MAKNHIIRSYNGLPDGQLGDFALHIATSLTGNGNFTTPPITTGALTTQATAYNVSVAACVNGTPAQTLDKNTKRDALINTLDTLANYVELTANNDPQKIISSGFSLASTTRQQAVPGMTSILSVNNVATGKLGLDLQTADNAWAYIVQYAPQSGGGQPLTATFTNPHDVTLENLSPGTLYSLRVLVMGSANQRTNWCDPVQHMST